MKRTTIGIRGKRALRTLATTLYVSIFTSVGVVTGTDYYFSNTGSDGNTGTSAETAWQTSAKMQETINSLSAGDRILLEKGSVWYEVELMITNRNGNSSLPIRFESYGNGEKPILSGGKKITSFTREGNIYTANVESSFPRGPILIPTCLLINNYAPDIARSEEFFTTGTNSWTQIVDNNQSWNSNELTGGMVIFQPVLWSWCASPISSNTANTVNFQRTNYIVKSNKWTAYFIANLDKYLQENGDWTFRNNELKIYSTDDLNTKDVRFAVSDSIIGIYNSSNIVFNDIAFELANYRHISSIGGSNIHIDNCEFGHSGGMAIKAHRTNNIKLTNSYVHNMGAMGILTSECANPIIRYNLFRLVSARKVGLGNYTFRFGAAVSNLTPGSAESYVEYNYFDSVGLAIQSHTFKSGYTGNYSRNYIENYGMTVADCAAIYCASDWDATPKTVNNNIIKNAVTSGFRYMPYGNYAINPHPALHPHALYVDEAGYGYHCDSNSIENASFAFYTNRSHSNVFSHNNVVNGNYNCPDRYNAVYIKDQSIGPTNFSADRDEVSRNNIVMNNSASGAVYLRHTSEYVAHAGDGNQFTFDHNKIADPFRSSTNLGKYVYNWGASESTYSLDQMRNNGDNVNANSSDNNTVFDPQSIEYSQVSGEVSEDEFVKFFTNFSHETRTVNLGSAVFRDMDGASISGTTTIPPFYSKILFYESGDIESVDPESYLDSTLVPYVTLVYSGGNQVAENTAPVIDDAELRVIELEVQPLDIGDLTYSDPDTDQTLTFSIVSGNDAGLFTITQTGRIRFTTSEVSFDGDPQYILTVQVQDNGSPSYSSHATVVVSLVSAQGFEDPNNTPNIEDQQFEVNQESQETLLIDEIIASDPDDGQTLSYSILSGNNEGLFTLSEAGDLYFTSDEISYSGNPTYHLTVAVTDDGTPNLNDQATITISLIESVDSEGNQAPIILPQSFNTNVDIGLSEVIGIVEADDADLDYLTYTIVSGNMDGLFTINEATGELSLIEAPEIYNGVSYILNIRVNDDGSPSLYAEASITVYIDASENLFFIDPANSDDPSADGSYGNPYPGWNDVEWIEGATYLQKRGTLCDASKVLILANNVTLGDYGSGASPVINSSATDYAFKVIDKHDVTIKNLTISAPNAIASVYFLGPECENNAIENCNLSGSEYGIRAIDGGSYSVKYTVLKNQVDGIYSITDNVDAYYNVFKSNTIAINLSSYSSTAHISNNVFYDNQQGVSASYSEVYLHNNIFYLTQPGYQAINHKLDKIVSDHNIFYPEQEGFIEVEDMQFANLSDYQSRYNLDLNSFSSDPKFMDIYNENFAVIESSKAIDAGVSVGIQQDFFGQSVPLGSAPDIGLAEKERSDVSSINEHSDIYGLDFNIYPNPSDGRFNLAFNNAPNSETDIMINSMNGQLIHSQTYDIEGNIVLEINISDQPSGMYLITVRSNNNVFSRRLVIE